MKNRSIYIWASALITLTACQADMDTPALDIPEADHKANITLLELKEAYEGLYNQAIYLPGTWTDANGNPIERDAQGNLVIVGQASGENHNGLIQNPDGSWSEADGGDIKIAGGTPVYISGRVVSSDASGNIYKSLVLQDETAALAFSINQGSLYNQYRLGQEVVVDMTGLYMGYYSGLQQVGYPDGDYNGVPQVGFMAYDYWLERAQCNGLPNPEFKVVPFGQQRPTDQFYMLQFKNFDELNNGTMPEMQSQLVEFRNVHFQFDSDDQELPYSTYQENANRTLVDANGKTLTVRNSGYSNFYYEMIPHGTGTVRGILSYYGSAWQLTLRDIRDVEIGKQGYEDDPFTVEEVISEQYAEMTGWTEGYIVGSVKAGVSQVTGSNDVVFGANAEMDNNVLIAQEADVTDWEKCVVVELPQNTMLRHFVNLLDNPGVYKKKLKVKGTLGWDLGCAAIVDSQGGRLDFYIDGEHVEDPTAAPDPAGDGTEATPYNISFVKQYEGADLADVWVEGYVAGFVAQGDYAEGNNEFAATGSGNNFNNSSNVILSGVPLPFCATGNSTPAQLNAKVRPVLGLKLNPAIYGAKVKVKCTIKEYLGVSGVRNITEVIVE